MWNYNLQALRNCFAYKFYSGTYSLHNRQIGIQVADLLDQSRDAGPNILQHTSYLHCTQVFVLPSCLLKNLNFLETSLKRNQLEQRQEVM